MEELAFLSVIVISALVIIWVIGVVLALSRWRRHPRVSLFALLAFGLMLVSRFQSVLLPPIMNNYGWTADQMGSIFFIVIGLITGLTSAVAWAFVLCAIFGWRDQRQKENLFPPAPPTFGNEPREQNAT
jgi:heme/copper-type cytochrome/quinol oxidase subunit 2